MLSIHTYTIRIGRIIALVSAMSAIPGVCAALIADRSLGLTRSVEGDSFICSGALFDASTGDRPTQRAGVAITGTKRIITCEAIAVLEPGVNALSVNLGTAPHLALDPLATGDAEDVVACACGEIERESHTLSALMDTAIQRSPLEASSARGAQQTQQRSARCTCRCVIEHITLEDIRPIWHIPALPSRFERVKWPLESCGLSQILASTDYHPRFYMLDGLADGMATSHLATAVATAAAAQADTRTSPYASRVAPIDRMAVLAATWLNDEQTNMRIVRPPFHNPVDASHAPGTAAASAVGAAVIAATTSAREHLTTQETITLMHGQALPFRTVSVHAGQHGREVAFRLPYCIDECLMSITRIPDDQTIIDYMVACLVASPGDPNAPRWIYRVLQLTLGIYSHLGTIMRGTASANSESTSTIPLNRAAEDAIAMVMSVIAGATDKTSETIADVGNTWEGRLRRKYCTAVGATTVVQMLTAVHHFSRDIVRCANMLSETLYPMWNASITDPRARQTLVMRLHMDPVIANTISLMQIERRDAVLVDAGATGDILRFAQSGQGARTRLTANMLVPAVAVRVRIGVRFVHTRSST